MALKEDPPLRKLIDLVLWHGHPSVKLTIVVERGHIQVGVDKTPRRKGDPTQWLTATHSGGADTGGSRDVDELAMGVLLELAESTVNQAVTPKRES